MIIIYMQGRLGNQMFQYAAAKQMEKDLHEKVYFDWSDVKKYHKSDDDGWEDSLCHFNTKYESINSYHISGLEAVVKLNYYASRVNLRLFKFARKRIEKLVIVKKIESRMGIHIFDTGFYPIMYNQNREINYYRGYFESDKYFPDLEEQLKADFTPVNDKKVENKWLYDLIEGNESICVSIRRGDFFSSENSSMYGVCNKEYYISGVDYILSKHPNAVVIAFSDDIEWVKQNIDFGVQTYYESGNDELWEKLRLMYSCKHFVISNSTFSWWAQYLSRNKNKIVVAPSIWRRDGKKNDIYQDKWHIIDVK